MVVNFLAHLGRRVVGEVGAGDQQDAIAGGAELGQKTAEPHARVGVSA